MDETQTTINSYNLNAIAYADKFMDHKPYETQVKAFAQLLASGDSILEIGCGPGNVAKQMLAVKPFQFTGFDLSAEMVKLASANAPSGKFFRQDVRLAEFDESSFDAVMLSFSIVHLTDVEAYKLLNKAIIWTKENGRLFVSFMEGKEKGFETTSFSEDPIFFNYFSSNEVVELLKREQVEPFSLAKQDYPEQDGTVTTDVFIFGRKKQLP